MKSWSRAGSRTRIGNIFEEYFQHRLPIDPSQMTRFRSRLGPSGCEKFSEPLARIARLLAQQRHDHDKLYSLHAPEVECIAKGKVHKKYEFGVKVSLAVTQRDNFIVGALALPGTPSSDMRNTTL